MHFTGFELVDRNLNTTWVSFAPSGFIIAIPTETFSLLFYGLLVMKQACVKPSLEPRLSVPYFVSQLWRKIEGKAWKDFSRDMVAPLHQSTSRKGTECSVLPRVWGKEDAKVKTKSKAIELPGVGMGATKKLLIKAPFSYKLLGYLQIYFVMLQPISSCLIMNKLPKQIETVCTRVWGMQGP